MAGAQCSPYHEARRSTSKGSTHHRSCFFKEQLLSMARALRIGGVGPRSTKAELWDAINRTMHDRYGCASGDEHCWVDKDTSAARHADSLVPAAPSEWTANPEAWLSNFDILNVLTQYERRYPSFKFVGVFPINFAQRDTFGRCVSEAMCSLRLSALKKKYSSVGVVFNLDRHDQPGSHWVCAYVGLTEPNRGFYYFDSNAEPMPPEVRRFAKSVVDQAKDDKEPFEVRENTVRKQFENNECGMFCIHFILMCLRRKPFDDIVASKFYDRHANALRKELFRTKKQI